jgi:serine protease AprX
MLNHHKDIALRPRYFARASLRRCYVSLFASLVAISLATPLFAATFQASPDLRAKSDSWVLDQFAAKSKVPLLVQLPELADLSRAAEFADKTERGRFVYETLRAHAEASQRELRRWLGERGVAHRPFWITNMILVEADAVTANALSQRADVKRLSANPTVQFKAPVREVIEASHRKTTDAINAVAAMEPGVNKIRAPELWNLGYTGQSIVIAGADTGYQWNHPALIGKYRGWNGTTADHNYHWHDAIHSGGGSCGANALAPCDDGTHGTHTMGTMVGDDGAGNQIGVAPGARWIGCRNMDRGNGTPATYAECFQWFIAPTDLAGNNPNPAMAPHVINNSWSCPPSEGCTNPDVLKTVVESVQAAGILVVVSAGNSGSACNRVDDPAAIYEASFTVGATNGASSTDAIASFSSRGPVTIDGSGRMKPDIAAPGVSVRSSVPTNSYDVKNGTSMAGPHVAGAAALLMSAYPALIGSPDAIKRVLKRTAVRRTDSANCGSPATTVPNNAYGWGRIDVKAAYDGAPGATLNVDQSTPTQAYDGSTDGVLIARYLAGFTGTALVGDALSATATVTDPATVSARLDAMRPALDIDGDGQHRLATDGLLVLRYLLGLRGGSLVSRAVASGAPRNSAADIAAYIQLLMP